MRKLSTRRDPMNGTVLSNQIPPKIREPFEVADICQREGQIWEMRCAAIAKLSALPNQKLRDSLAATVNVRFDPRRAPKMLDTLCKCRGPHVHVRWTGREFIAREPSSREAMGSATRRLAHIVLTERRNRTFAARALCNRRRRRLHSPAGKSVRHPQRAAVRDPLGHGSAGRLLRAGLNAATRAGSSRDRYDSHPADGGRSGPT